MLGDDRERTGAAREAARGCHDLLGLPDLHEATLLHTVQLRFRQDLVYTEMGPIVLAVNPFKYSIPAYQVLPSTPSPVWFLLQQFLVPGVHFWTLEFWT